MRVEHRRREAGVELVAMLAKLAHRAEHRDAPRRRRAPRRGSSASPPSTPDWRCSFRRSAALRRRRAAIMWRSPRPLSPPMSASASPATRDVARRRASTAASTASAFDTQCSPRCEMVKVSSRSSSAARDQASAARRRDRVHRMHVGIAAAEGDDPVGMAARRLDQPVAMRRVVGDDRDAVGLEPLEDLAPWRRRSPPPSRGSRCAPGRSR